VQPKIVGDAVGLSVTLTFLSLIFWSYVVGALGALLAIPLSVLAKALLVDADPGSRWPRPLLGDTSADDGPPRADADAAGAWTTETRSDGGHGPGRDGEEER
jgi:AI-2 transport protein TqsA